MVVSRSAGRSARYSRADSVSDTHTHTHTHALGQSAAALFLQLWVCGFKEHVCALAAALRITGCSFPRSFVLLVCAAAAHTHSETHTHTTSARTRTASLKQVVFTWENVSVDKSKSCYCANYCPPFTYKLSLSSHVLLQQNDTSHILQYPAPTKDLLLDLVTCS